MPRSFHRPLSGTEWLLGVGTEHDAGIRPFSADVSLANTTKNTTVCKPPLEIVHTVSTKNIVHYFNGS